MAGAHPAHRGHGARGERGRRRHGDGGRGRPGWDVICKMPSRQPPSKDGRTEPRRSRVLLRWLGSTEESRWLVVLCAPSRREEMPVLAREDFEATPLCFDSSSVRGPERIGGCFVEKFFRFRRGVARRGGVGGYALRTRGRMAATGVVTPRSAAAPASPFTLCSRFPLYTGWVRFSYSVAVGRTCPRGQAVGEGFAVGTGGDEIEECLRWRRRLHGFAVFVARV